MQLNNQHDDLVTWRIRVDFLPKVFKGLKLSTCSNLEGLTCKSPNFNQGSLWSFFESLRSILVVSGFSLIDFSFCFGSLTLFQFSCSFEGFWTVLVLFMQYPLLHDHKHKNTISLAIIVSFWSF